MNRRNASDGLNIKNKILRKMSPNVEFVLQKRYISLRAGGQITRTETKQTRGERGEQASWIDF